VPTDVKRAGRCGHDKWMVLALWRSRDLALKTAELASPQSRGQPSRNEVIVAIGQAPGGPTHLALYRVPGQQGKTHEEAKAFREALRSLALVVNMEAERPQLLPNPRFALLAEWREVDQCTPPRSHRRGEVRFVEARGTGRDWRLGATEIAIDVRRLCLFSFTEAALTAHWAREEGRTTVMSCGGVCGCPVRPRTAH
jgi:hypothetical protein